MALALEHHPRLREAQANEEAAGARVDEVRSNELPTAGVSAEINQSTGNTPPGAFFYAPGFVPVSGAPRGKTLDEGTLQTGVSAWASWDVLSLLRQAAAVDVALAGRAQAGASHDARRLEVAYVAADAFISLVCANETVKAARLQSESRARLRYRRQDPRRPEPTARGRRSAGRRRAGLGAHPAGSCRADRAKFGARNSRRP